MLEVSTLYFAAALIGAVIAGVIALVRDPDRRHNGLRALLQASITLSMALALLGMRGVVGDWLSQGVGVSLLIASAFLYRLAVDRLTEREEWTRVPSGVAGAALLLVWGSIIGDAPEQVRAVIGSLAIAIVLCLPAWTLLGGALSWRGRSRYLAGGAFLASAAAALARGIAVSAGATPVSPTQASASNLALATVVVVMVTIVSFSFLVLLREREHARLAMLDALTETLNRRTFMERAEGLLSLARRRDLACSLVLLDLDLFEKINDAHGYEQGDRVLRHVADLLRRTLRREDAYGRTGGDEFAMLLFATPMAGGQALAQRIANALAAHPPKIRQAGISVTGSFGVAECVHGSCQTVEDLLHRADHARDAAKDRGRNCIVREDEIRA